MEELDDTLEAFYPNINYYHEIEIDVVFSQFQEIYLVASGSTITSTIGKKNTRLYNPLK